MTKDDIMRMAREAGFAAVLEEHASEYGNGTFENTPYPELERFADLVAAAEREIIAQSMDKQADLAPDDIDRQWAQEMAAAIRARITT